MKKILLATLILGISFASFAKTIYHTQDETFMKDVKVNESFTQGDSSTATGENSVAIGYSANATNDNSFVFNGDSTKENYSSHDKDGSFNINPPDGIEGFYIGERNLQEVLDQETVTSITVNNKILTNDVTIQNGNSYISVSTEGNAIKISGANIPAPANNATLTIMTNNETAGTFSADADENVDIDITIPTKLSDLENDVVNDAQFIITTNNNPAATFSANANANVNLNITIPTNLTDLNNDLVNDKTLTIKTNNVSAGTFSANADADKEINIEIPPPANTGNLKIQVNGSDIQTFNADSAESKTANIIVPTVNDGTLTINTNGNSAGTFTANQNNNSTISINYPTNLNGLTDVSIETPQDQQFLVYDNESETWTNTTVEFSGNYVPLIEDKNDEFTAVSIGSRVDDIPIGIGSIVHGTNLIASGDYSFASGTAYKIGDTDLKVSEETFNGQYSQNQLVVINDNSIHYKFRPGDIFHLIPYGETEEYIYPIITATEPHDYAYILTFNSDINVHDLLRDLDYDEVNVERFFTTSANDNNAYAIGLGSIANNDYSIALGKLALSSNDYAYVWSGIDTNIQYGSHGIGTFNVNPVGGLEGFWIGTNTLSTEIADMAGTVVTNIFNDKTIIISNTLNKSSSITNNILTNSVFPIPYAEHPVVFYNRYAESEADCFVDENANFASLALWHTINAGDHNYDSTNRPGFYSVSFSSEGPGSATKNYATGTSSFSHGMNTRAEGNASHAEGDGCMVFKGVNGEDFVRAAHVEGVKAIATNKYTYVFNGNDQKYYYSHGNGTFNINPNNPTNDFWIGEHPFAWYLTNNRVPLPENIVYYSQDTNDDWTAITSGIRDESFDTGVRSILVGEPTTNNSTYVSGTIYVKPQNNILIPFEDYLVYNNYSDSVNPFTAEWEVGSDKLHVGDILVISDKAWKIDDDASSTTYGQVIPQDSTAKTIDAAVTGINTDDNTVTIAVYIRPNSAAGDYSVSIGKSTMAMGDYSIALGGYSGAFGISSLAFGDNCYTYGDYSYAQGKYNSTTGTASVAFGDNNVAGGEASFAAGRYSHAIGDFSYAQGDHVIATESNSFAIGQYAQSTNEYAYVWNGMSYMELTNDKSANISLDARALPKSQSTNEFAGMTNYYHSHGRGTYNVNPIDGLEGFFIGESNLLQHIEAHGGSGLPTGGNEGDVLTINSGGTPEWQELDLTDYISYDELKAVINSEHYSPAINLNTAIERANGIWTTVSNLVGDRSASINSLDIRALSDPNESNELPETINSLLSESQNRPARAENLIGYWPGNIWGMNGRTILNYATGGASNNLECTSTVTESSDVANHNMTYPISNISVATGGTGYDENTVLEIYDNTGSGAICTPTIENGVITGVTLVSGGSKYISPVVYARRSEEVEGETDATFNVTLDTSSGIINGTSFKPPQINTTDEAAATGSIHSEEDWDPLVGLQSFTVMAWVKKTYVRTSTSQGYRYRIISDYSARDADGYGFELRTTGADGAIEIVINGVKYNPANSSIFPANSESDWHHLAVTWTNGGTYKTKFYLDGTAKGSGSSSQSTGPRKNYNAFTIGNSSSSQEIGTSWPGLIDDVMIFNRALTQAEIRDWMNYNDNYEPLPRSVGEPIELGVMDPTTTIYSASQLENVFGINNFSEQIAQLKSAESTVPVYTYQDITAASFAFDLANNYRFILTPGGAGGTYNIPLPATTADKLGRLELYLMQASNFHFDISKTSESAVVASSFPTSPGWTSGTSSWKIELQSPYGSTKWYYVNSTEFVAE